MNINKHTDDNELIVDIVLDTSEFSIKDDLYYLYDDEILQDVATSYAGSDYIFDFSVEPTGTDSEMIISYYFNRK